MIMRHIFIILLLLSTSCKSKRKSIFLTAHKGSYCKGTHGIILNGIQIEQCCSTKGSNALLDEEDPPYALGYQTKVPGLYSCPKITDSDETFLFNTVNDNAHLNDYICEVSKRFDLNQENLYCNSSNTNILSTTTTGFSTGTTVESFSANSSNKKNSHTQLNALADTALFESNKTDTLSFARSQKEHTTVINKGPSTNSGLTDSRSDKTISTSFSSTTNSNSPSKTHSLSGFGFLNDASTKTTAGMPISQHDTRQKNNPDEDARARESPTSSTITDSALSVTTGPLLDTTSTSTRPSTSLSMNSTLSSTEDTGLDHFNDSEQSDQSASEVNTLKRTNTSQDRASLETLENLNTYFLKIDIAESLFRIIQKRYFQIFLSLEKDKINVIKK
jgi:hypothetical protein